MVDTTLLDLFLNGNRKTFLISHDLLAKAILFALVKANDTGKNYTLLKSALNDSISNMRAIEASLMSQVSEVPLTEEDGQYDSIIQVKNEIGKIAKLSQAFQKASPSELSVFYEKDICTVNECSPALPSVFRADQSEWHYRERDAMPEGINVLLHVVCGVKPTRNKMELIELFSSPPKSERYPKLFSFSEQSIRDVIDNANQLIVATGWDFVLKKVIEPSARICLETISPTLDQSAHIRLVEIMIRYFIGDLVVEKNIVADKIEEEKTRIKNLSDDITKKFIGELTSTLNTGQGSNSAFARRNTPSSTLEEYKEKILLLFYRPPAETITVNKVAVAQPAGIIVKNDADLKRENELLRAQLETLMARCPRKTLEFHVAAGDDKSGKAKAILDERYIRYLNSKKPSGPPQGGPSEAGAGADPKAKIVLQK